MILVISSKKVYAAKRLEQEAGIRSAGGGSASGGNQELEIMDMQDLVACGFNIDIGRFDVLYVRDPYFNGSAEYLPQIIKLAKRFKAAGKRVVDAVIVNGEIGRGKWADYQKLQKAGLPIPKTSLMSVIARSAADEAILSNGRLPRLSPVRLRSSLDFARGDLERQSNRSGRLELAEMADALGTRNDNINYPLILKWTYGFKGKHIFLVRDEAALHRVAQKYPADEFLVQELIKADYEYKVITVGYKALPVILRFKIKDSGFRADFQEYRVIQTLTTSPRFAGYSSLKKEERLREMSEDNCGASPPAKEGWLAKRDGVVGADKIKEIIHLAESASRLLGRELAKVDILESAGKFYVLEVNRFPGLKSFEGLTKFNAVKAFLGYLPR